MSTRRPGTAPRAPRLLLRAAAGIAVLLVLLGGVGGPAAATEGEGAEIPAFEELAQNEAAADFLPAEYDKPAFFDWFIYPLLALGLLAAIGVGFRYLQWQPRFVREARSKRRR